jgi:hypothetical protein
MKKTIVAFSFFFLAVCGYGQSKQSDIDKMLNAAFAGGEALL